MRKENEEVLLFDAEIVKEVLDGNHRKAAYLAARRAHHPRPKQSDSSDLKSNESSDSEMAMTKIIKNQLDSTSAGADSVDPAVPADMMVDHAKAKSLDTEPIDNSNSVARLESATKPVVEDDVGKIAAVTEAEAETLVTREPTNEKEWLDYYDKISASLGNSDEYCFGYREFASAAASLRVEWLEPGEKFLVSEYDGDETLLRKNDLRHVA